MLWQRGRQSSNIEDRRGMGGGVGRGVRVGGGLGLGGIAVVLIAMFLGVDPRLVTGLVGGDGGVGEEQIALPRGTAPSNDQTAQFVGSVLGTTEDVWNAEFEKLGKRYQEPALVLFSEAANSACGMAQSATGPFYCPGDEKVYLDTAFFDELARRFGAPGDFAAAYVIAHEVGHHVQNQLGIMDRIQSMRERASRSDSNYLSVLLELQADCLAGVWARSVHERFGMLQRGDVEEALGAAAAVGDDRLQEQAQGRVVPDSFTHGSSADRAKWFGIGLEQGDLRACDTFKQAGL